MITFYLLNTPARWGGGGSLFYFTHVVAGEAWQDLVKAIPSWRESEIWNLESGSFPISILMDKRHITPFCRTLPAAKPLKETVIRDWIQTFDSRKGRDTLVETSRAIGKQREKSHLSFISGDLQGEDGSGTMLLAPPHFPQLSEELIILWDESSKYAF